MQIPTQTSTLTRRPPPPPPPPPEQVDCDSCSKLDEFWDMCAMHFPGLIWTADCNDVPLVCEQAGIDKMMRSGTQHTAHGTRHRQRRQHTAHSTSCPMHTHHHHQSNNPSAYATNTSLNMLSMPCSMPWVVFFHLPLMMMCAITIVTSPMRRHGRPRLHDLDGAGDGTVRRQVCRQSAAVCSECTPSSLIVA